MERIKKNWLDFSVYCGDNVNLYNGDCLDVMDLMIEDNTKVDMILCDLPYGTTACIWDIVIPLQSLWERYKQIIKPNGAIVLFASTPFDKILGCSNLQWLKYEWIWDKVQPTGALTVKKRPMKQHENILVFYNQQPTYNRQMADRKKEDLRVNAVRNKNNQKTNYGYEHTGGMTMKYAADYDPTKVNPKSILTYSKQPTRTKNLHPTQKPVALCEYLIKTYTNEGEIVLDNTIGSGTTAVACQNTNRQCIGIEKDKSIYDIAVKRLNDIWIDKQNKSENELF